MVLMLLMMLLVFSGCSAPSAPTTPAPTPTPQKEVVLTPTGKFYLQAEKVRNRLRFYGEEIKTTYKSDKQIALFENVRETIKPACTEMARLIEEEKLTNPLILDTQATCANLDQVFAQHDMTKIQDGLRAFKSAVEALQLSLKPPVQKN